MSGPRQFLADRHTQAEGYGGDYVDSAYITQVHYVDGPLTRERI